MRSVVKLNPGDSTPSGETILTDYVPYTRAKRPLVDNIGDYCSYCERPLPGSELDVEHVMPKDLPPHEATKWTNFLLACSNCNRAKWNNPVDLNHHHFPHLVNTYAIFDGRFGSNLGLRNGLQIADQKRAENTIQLLRLNRNSTTDPAATDGDDRYVYRNAASSLVTKYLTKWLNGECHTEVIVDLARGYGYWSIWMDAFVAYPEVQDALIAAFPGTYPDCRNGRIERP